MRRDAIVKNANTGLFLDAIAALDERGAEEACLIVVDGEPGLGKTRTVEWFAAQHGCPLVRAKASWTAAWMMREILAALGVTPAYSFERMFAQAIDSLRRGIDAAQREGEPYALIVDEVDYIADSGRMLDTLRDLSDLLELPIVLVGMGKIKSKLTRHSQVASRVARFVEFAPATADDVAALATAVCEVPIAPDLAALITRESRGRAREVKEAFVAVERFGKRNTPGPEGVTVADMDGQVLMMDRSNGREIRVRAR